MLNRAMGSAFAALVGFSTLPATAQGLPAEIKSKYPNGVYTSTRTYNIPRASCVPCKNNEGDYVQEREAIPYKMNTKTARIICVPDPRDNKPGDDPCVFNEPRSVTIDNIGMVATINYKSRSNAVIIQLEADILDDQNNTQ